MIAFDLALLSFGTSLLQRLQQFAPKLSPWVRKCCLLLSKRQFGGTSASRFDFDRRSRRGRRFRKAGDLPD